jgi:alanine racemase
MTPHLRPVWAEVDLGAITRNAARLKALAGDAELCAVVKAQAYGHGPVRAADAALNGGATWLGVALVEEGVALRDAGITEPVLVLSEPPHDGDTWATVVRHRLTPTVYTQAAVEAAAKAVVAAGGDPLPVHVKVDTGMHRVGAAPADAAELACAVDGRAELVLDGLFTHFAVADEVDGAGVAFTDAQVAAFRRVVDALAARGVRPRLLHACNSAGLLAHPDAAFDLVRCGIALYGLAPAPDLADRCAGLEPAMALKARVSYVKPVAAGERVSYGLCYRFDRPSWVATVPIGYADGVPRSLGASGGEVLIGGRRRPIAGTVTMDQLLVDCGDDTSVAVGDEVVLIGRQGDDVVSAWEWASRTGTIAYEIVCGISGRVPRDWVQ